MTDATHAADDRPSPAVGVAETRPGWRGVLREFATIVAGVLVALAGQAWWSAREERARELDYLRQLYGDTRENERRLDASLSRESEVRASQTALANALYAPRPLPSVDSLRRLLDGPVFSAQAFEPLTGTFTALLTTGDLRLIRTDTLRSRLVAYAAMLDGESERQRLAIGQAFGDPGRIAKAIPSLRRTFANLSEAEERVARESDGPSLRRLRDDPEFGAVIFALQASNGNRIGRLRFQRARTEELRLVLEAERDLHANVEAARAEDRARTDSVRADSVRTR